METPLLFVPVLTFKGLVTFTELPDGQLYFAMIHNGISFFLFDVRGHADQNDLSITAGGHVAIFNLFQMAAVDRCRYLESAGTPDMLSQPLSPEHNQCPPDCKQD